MKPKKPRKRKGVGTHYSYLGGGGRYDTSKGTPRKVTQIFNLEKTGVNTRRRVIHELIEKKGECLARLPVQFERDCDLDELERFLEGEL